jgi:hypothetical protein
MSDINITDLHSIMPPPSFGEPTTAAGTGEAGKTQQNPSVHKIQSDELSKATEALVYSSSTLMDPNDARLPFPPPLARDVAGAAGGKDPTGKGNPWLSPIPFVQITIAMLKFYETLRQSNLGMAQFENSTMKLVMSMAETQAKLVEHSADMESKMAMFEAAAGALAMAGATVGLGCALKAHLDSAPATDAAKANHSTAKNEQGTAATAHTKSQTELKTMQDSYKVKQNEHLEQTQTNAVEARQAQRGAEKDLASAKVELNNASSKDKAAAQIKVDRAQKDLDMKTATREQADSAFIDAKKDVDARYNYSSSTPAAKTDADAAAGTSPTVASGATVTAKPAAKAGTSPTVADKEAFTTQAKVDANKTAKADQANMTQEQKAIEAKKAEVASTKADLDKADAKVVETKSIRDKEEQMYSQNMTTASTIGGMLNTLITQMGAMMNSIAKSFLIVEKGHSDAQQKIVEAEQQLLNTILQRAQSHMQKQSDVMASTLQTMMKIEDEHVRASSTSING